MEKEQFVNQLLSEMTTRQKVGQCLVIGFCGTVITPTILRRIREYNPAGVRVSTTFRAKTALHDPYATSKEFAYRVLRDPVGTVKDIIPKRPTPHCTNEEYCHFLNIMKREALKSNLQIPLHVTMDMEGDVSCDYTRGGLFNFPYPMGLAAGGKTENTYDGAWATGRQLRALGVNWLHSPVLDVNTEPMNPEIGARSYGENANTVIEYAGRALQGFRDANIIATGKHFPGRGASVSDAHRSLPVIDIGLDELEEHLKPFKAMVDAGIPTIMTAHTLFPALDPDEPATLSKKIITDLLKKRWGFKGVVTSDDITMGGIVAKYEVHEACVKAINAGADLILLRDESPLIDEVFEKLVQSVEAGEISVERLNDAVSRTLSVKYDYGLFENGNIADEQLAGAGINDSRVAEIAERLAWDALTVIRDENNLLPLNRDQKILLVEQRNPLHERTESQRCHPGILWELMLEHSEQVFQVETELDHTPDDRARALKRVQEADVIVTTNYFDRRAHTESNFVSELHRQNKPVIVVTNSPYPFTVHPEYKAVICTYSSSPESLKAVAAKIFGKS